MSHACSEAFIFFFFFFNAQCVVGASCRRVQSWFSFLSSFHSLIHLFIVLLRRATVFCKFSESKLDAFRALYGCSIHQHLSRNFLAFCPKAHAPYGCHLLISITQLSSTSPKACCLQSCKKLSTEVLYSELQLWPALNHAGLSLH